MSLAQPSADYIDANTDPTIAYVDLSGSILPGDYAPAKNQYFYESGSWFDVNPSNYRHDHTPGGM